MYLLFVIQNEWIEFNRNHEIAFIEYQSFESNILQNKTKQNETFYK